MPKKMAGNMMLLIAAMIWGAAFVAQSVGMDYVGPFTFQASRCLLAALVLLLVIPIMDRMGLGQRPSSSKERKFLLISGVVCGLFLFAACSLQQIGLQYTEAGKAGFLTSLYIIFVPLAGVFFRRRIPVQVWLAAALALVGLYLLCAADMSIGKGEILVLLCAVAFTGHILVIGHVTSRVDGVRLSCIQFFVCSTLSVPFMLFTETPSITGLSQCWLPLVYAGVLSGGAGYTLQILGQRHTEPATASLLMSLEAVFAVVFGWILLKQTLSVPEFIGCGLVFAGVVLAQLPTKKH